MGWQVPRAQEIPAGGEAPHGPCSTSKSFLWEGPGSFWSPASAADIRMRAAGLRTGPWGRQRGGPGRFHLSLLDLEACLGAGRTRLWARVA